jgi:hypothetical protein
MVKGDRLAYFAFRISTSEKAVLGQRFWAQGYLVVSSGNITDDMMQQYIEEQEGEPVVDDSRIQIDPSYTPGLTDEGSLVMPVSLI